MAIQRQDDFFFGDPKFSGGAFEDTAVGLVGHEPVDGAGGHASFGQHFLTALTATNFRQLWIPPNFAHGFLVISETAEVEYKVTEPYRPQSEIAIAWNDPELGVPWPVLVPTLSARDSAAPRLAELREKLPRYQG